MLLGVDLGTTNVKAVLVARDGRVVARGSAPVPTHHIAGGVEQDVEGIFHDNARRLIDSVLAAKKDW